MPVRPQKITYTLRQILVNNDNWWNFYTQHKNKIRDSITKAIVRLLSCKQKIRGQQVYCCSNPKCQQTKVVPMTCKSRACPSCGKKATESWIQKQNNLLPHTSWQHITFTMPEQLWDFFWYNRSLFNEISAIAAQCVKKIANNKKVIPAIFTALHSFGRSLKRNIHVHLSTTTGGLTYNHQQWRTVFFKQNLLMTQWRYHIIKLFRQHADQLIIPPATKQQLSPHFTLNQFLDQLYKKNWIVHCSKPNNNPKKNIKYLARYIKRPPIAQSKIKHYDGNEVVFNYLDHRSKQYRHHKLSVDDFIAKLIQHIPDQHFRLIRYYGCLAHRVRGKLLPIVRELLGQTEQITPTADYASLLKRDFNCNPFTCILCGSQMILSEFIRGITNTTKLLDYHEQLAKIRIGQHA